MRIDELEELLATLAAEGRRPKFIYSVPSFQNPAGVTMSARAAAAAGRAGARARDARRRGQPLRPAALRGRAAAAALPARRRRLRHLHRHLLEDPLARDPARLGGGAAAGDGEDRARQAGGRPLHLDPDPVLRPRVLRRGPLARLHRRAWCEIYRGRRDAMLEALERHFPAQATWTEPEGGLFIWATLPDYIDTTDLLAKALRENVAFVPGAGRLRRRAAAAQLDAAQLLRLRRGRDPRGHPADRQGDRRAGRALRDDHRRAHAPRPAATAATTPRRAGRRATSCRCAAGGQGGDEGRGAEGRPLAGAQRLAALRGAGRGRARRARPRGGRASTSAPTWSSDLEGRAPRRRLRRPARRRRRGRDRRRSCSRSSASPTPGPASPPASAAWTRSPPSTSCARPGIPTPDWVAFNATAFRELGAADALEEIEAGLGFPLVVKPAAAAPRSGSSFAAAARARSRRRWSPPSATTTGCCSSATSRAASWRSSVLDGEPLPVVEAIPARGTASTTRPATRSAAPSTSARPSSARGASGAVHRRRAADLRGASAARASPAST